ncbi:DNA repair radA domain protein, partial [Mycobacterium kansasii 662]
MGDPSSNVDLPTPGSPASSVTDPGTTPPPSTRSSSSMPVGRVPAQVGPDRTDRDGVRCRHAASTADSAEYGYLFDGAPAAAFQAPPHPLCGAVATIRAAELRTRISHAVTVSTGYDNPVVA